MGGEIEDSSDQYLSLVGSLLGFRPLCMSEIQYDCDAMKIMECFVDRGGSEGGVLIGVDW